MPDRFDYIDVHCHLDDESFEPDRDSVVNRAKGILMLCASQEPKSSRKVLSLAERYPNVRACLGIHPASIPDLTDREIEAEADFIRHSAQRIVAISEVGLDHHWVRDEAQRRRAREAFRMLLELAAELGLPVVVHCRDATADVLKAVSQFNGVVILHSFPGRPEEVEVAIGRNYYLSVAPSIYRSRQKQELVKMVPLGQLLTESDAPVLGIDKRERNEPVNVMKVVAKIAELKGLREQNVSEALIGNFYKIFPAERS